jgi:Ca2+-binding EF-hand superfamily protein
MQVPNSELIIIAEDIVSKNFDFHQFCTEYKTLLDPEKNRKDLTAESVYKFMFSMIKTLIINSLKTNTTPSNKSRYMINRNEFLESENARLAKEIYNMQAREPQNLIQNLSKYLASATKIQAAWRGFKLRSNLKPIINSLRKNKKKYQSSSQKSLISVKAAIETLNLTFEDCYRASDKNNDGVVTTEEYTNFLFKLKLKVPRGVIIKAIEMLDENCTGSIERDEFYESLECYGIDSEDHESQQVPYLHRVLTKFYKKCEELNLDFISIFRSCTTTDKASADALLKSIQNSLGLLNRESNYLIRRLDLDHTGLVSLSDYMNLFNQNFLTLRPKTQAIIMTSDILQKEKTQENPSVKETQPVLSNKKSEESKPENIQKKLACHKFLEVLDKYSLDPIGLFRFSNKTKSNSITLKQYFSGLQKLIPDFEKSFSYEELCNILPENINKQILDNLFPLNEKIDETSNYSSYWIKRFNTLASKKNINTQILFASADMDKDGLIAKEDFENTLNQIFGKEFSVSEIDNIAQSYGIEDKKTYDYKNFYNLMAKAQ